MNMHKKITGIFLAISMAFASVAPAVATVTDENALRELKREVQLAIRADIGLLTDQVNAVQVQIVPGLTRSERQALYLERRQLRSQLRRLTNRLRLSRDWSAQRIRYFSRVYLAPDVSPA